MEKKGNKIVVVVRVRPIPTDAQEAVRARGECVVPQEAPNQILCVDTVNTAGMRRQPALYEYDRIYWPDSTTDALYGETISPLVGGFIEGYHAAVLAYGQTSSGKTHTMIGSESNPGVVELAVNDLLAQLRSLPVDQVWKLEASFFEIHKSSLIDLLLTPGQDTVKPLIIRQNGSVDNLVRKTVASSDYVMKLLSDGTKLRHTARTGANEHSSRSHAILQLYLTIDSVTENGCATATRSATMSFVDLAGSERVTDTKAAEKRLDEAKDINKSLTALGVIIRGLSEQSTALCYRDSKLTHVLQSALGGNSRTAIICCVSPAPQYYQLTSSTLQFARSANRVVCHAEKNIMLSDEQVIKKLRAENQQLRERVSALEMLQKTESAVISLEDIQSDPSFAVLDSELRTNQINAIRAFDTSFHEALDEAPGLPRPPSDNYDYIPWRTSLSSPILYPEEATQTVGLTPELIEAEVQCEDDEGERVRVTLAERDSQLREAQALLDSLTQRCEAETAERTRLQAQNEEYAKALEQSQAEAKEAQEGLRSALERFDQAVARGDELEQRVAAQSASAESQASEYGAQVRLVEVLRRDYNQVQAQLTYLQSTFVPSLEHWQQEKEELEETYRQQFILARERIVTTTLQKAQQRFMIEMDRYRQRCTEALVERVRQERQSKDETVEMYKTQLEQTKQLLSSINGQASGPIAPLAEEITSITD